MKYVLLISCFVVSTMLVMAQENKVPFNNDILNRSLIDSVKSNLQPNLMENFAYNNAVPIPTARPNPKYIYKTPVKKLSGRGLAKMPGTEPLDSLEKGKLKLDTAHKASPVIPNLILPAR